MAATIYGVVFNQVNMVCDLTSVATYSLLSRHEKILKNYMTLKIKGNRGQKSKTM